MESTNEDDTMQAFQQYMMGGMINSPTTSSKTKVSSSPQTQHSPSPRKQEYNFLKKSEKKCYSIYKKLLSAIQDDWIFIDNEIHKILQSMKHIRQRLSTEIHVLNSYNNQTSTLLQSLQSKYENNMNGTITKNDIHNAISYDVQENEYYIKQLIKFMNILLENHEYVYRIFDDLIIIYDSHISLLYSTSSHDEDDNNDADTNDNNVMVIFDKIKDMLTMLSREMHRKQCLYDTIAESVNDKDILLQSSNNSINNENMRDKSHKDVFEVCMNSWSYKSKDSCIDLDLVNDLLSLVL